jgi:hypothetical protein
MSEMDQDLDLDEVQQELSDLDVANLRNRRTELLKELLEIDDKLSSVQAHLLDTSAISKPCAFVREVCEMMSEAGAQRRAVRNFCIGKGVAKNTVDTQMSLWTRKTGHEWAAEAQ